MFILFKKLNLFVLNKSNNRYREKQCTRMLKC